MRIVVFGPGRRVGVLQGESVIDACGAYAKYLAERQGEPHPREVAAALVPPDLALFIEGGAAVLNRVQAAVDHLAGQDGHPLGLDGERIVHEASQVRLHAPLPNGARVACAGGNFADHAAAMATRRADVEEFADDVAAEIRRRGIWGFWKVDRPAVAPGGNVIYPARAGRLDYEGELAIVLGRRGKDIRAPDWREYVWGVTLVGDWSIRDFPEPAAPLKFAMVKNFETCLSLGPCIVVGELDAADTRVETYVNGERRQSYSTADMVFSFGDFLEYLSADLVLQPGDVISGGTAAGTAQDSSPLLADGRPAPERFLRPGDTVEVRSPGIGTLTAHIVAKPAG